MDVVQAQHYQKVLPYEAVQHLANALKVIIKEAMNRVRREEIGKDLPISDCLQLVENNASLVCNFSTSIKTSNKVKWCTILRQNEILYSVIFDMLVCIIYRIFLDFIATTQNFI